MARYYEIRVEGHLDRTWADWLGGLTIIHEENGETLLSGILVDQAALHGLLSRVRDLGLTLISVNQMAYDTQHDQSDPNTPQADN